MATMTTLRSLLHPVTILPSRTSPRLAYQQPSPFPRAILLHKQHPLHPLQVSPVPVPVPARRRIAVPASSAPYSDTEVQTPEEEPQQENEEEEAREFVNETQGEAAGEEVPLVEQAKPAPKRLRKDRARLYVGNIPFSTTADDLAELFSEAGTVNSVDVIYDKVTDRSRGFAFVTMSDVDEASEAVRMFDGSQLGGRLIKVNFPEVPRGAEREVLTASTIPSRGYVDSAHKIYAGNLGWGVSSEALKEAFSNQSGLLGAKVIFDRITGRSRGFGFVSFVSTEDAEAALESMNGVEVEGRPLRLSYANRELPLRSSSTETVTEGQESSLQTSSGKPGTSGHTIWPGVIASS